MSEPVSLSQVIDLAFAKQGVTSSRTLATKAKELGYPISYTTLSSIQSGRYTSRVGPQARKALAHLAGVRLDLVDRLAGYPLGEFELPPSADELEADQRDAVLYVVRALVNANRKVGDQSGDTATTKTAADDAAGDNVRHLGHANHDTWNGVERRQAADPKRPGKGKDRRSH